MDVQVVHDAQAVRDAQRDNLSRLGFWSSPIPLDNRPFESMSIAQQPDRLALTARPAMDLGLPKKKRRLDYLKCDFCRKAKKKCEPSERQWPGEKCQRCDQKGFPCSVPAKKNAPVPDPPSVGNSTSVEDGEQEYSHEQRAYCALTEKCIEQMRSGLKANICELAYLDTKRDEISPDCIDNALPKDLQYACRFWISHLCRAPDIFPADNRMQRLVHAFLTDYFLCWLEAIALLGMVDDGTGCLHSLGNLVLTITNNDELKDFVRDAKRFMIDFGLPFEDAPLTIYHLAREHLRGSMKGLIIPEIRARSRLQPTRTWVTMTSTLDLDYQDVISVAFSPDSDLIAVALTDKTVRLWNPSTGEYLRELRHYGIVTTIAFSPDGNRLAWAMKIHSFRSEIRLWDTMTRNQKKAMVKYHEISSIAFSLDGKRLLYTTADGTCLMSWDFTTDDESSVLQYGDRAIEVALSQDGKFLAVASIRQELQLWDLSVAGGERIFTTHGNMRRPNFSPNGRLLIADSLTENNIDVWDTNNGVNLRRLEADVIGPMAGRVTFLPNANLLAYPSYYRGTMLWNPLTGREQTLNFGDDRGSTGVYFSPNSKLIARLLGNRRVEIWELHHDR